MFEIAELKDTTYSATQDTLYNVYKTAGHHGRDLLCRVWGDSEDHVCMYAFPIYQTTRLNVVAERNQFDFTTGVNDNGFSLEVVRGNPTHRLILKGKGKKLTLEVETEGWFELCRALSKVQEITVEDGPTYTE